MKINKLIPALAIALVAAVSVKAQTLKDAIKYSDAERYDLADAAFKKLLVAEPANGDIYYYFGKNLMSTENVDSAEVMFRQGIEKAPANPLNHVGLAAAAMQRGNKAQAQPNIDKALSLSENKSIPVFIEAAYALINYPVKDTVQAMKLVSKAREIDLGKDKKPKTAALYTAIGDVCLEAHPGQGGDAMNNYDRALLLDKGSYKTYLRIGQLWVRAHVFEDALKAYDNAIKIDSTFAPAYREKGDFFYMFDKYGLAKEQYKKYLSLAKNNYKARIRYAKFLFLAKQYVDCITEIEAILKVDPNQPVLIRLLAYCYFETRKYPEGLTQMKKFMEVQPADKLIPKDFEYYGKLLVKNNQDSLGLKVLLDAYNKDTTNKELTGFIGEAYKNQKKYAEAAKYYAIKTTMTKGVATVDWLNLGQMYSFTKQLGKADTAYQNAIKIQPDYYKTYLLRARVLNKMDTLEPKTFAAKASYELFLNKMELKDKEAEANKTSIVEAYKFIGYSYYTNKEYPFALFCFNKALAVKADDKDILDFLKKKEFEGVTEAEPPVNP